jgi:adenylyltransferase/sulfurtransferase
MGVLQALEAIKIIARDPEIEGLPPQMHLFSTCPSLSLRSVRLRPRRPQCASCSRTATVTQESLTSGSLDYVAFCGGLVGEVNVLPIGERVLANDFVANGSNIIVTSSSSRDTRDLTTPLVLDLREKTLFDIYHIRDSVNVPYSQLSSWRSVSDIPDVVKFEGRSKILLLCAKGNDSQLGAVKLRSLLGGASKITDIAGGWSSLRGLVDFPRM